MTQHCVSIERNLARHTKTTFRREPNFGTYLTGQRIAEMRLFERYHFVRKTRTGRRESRKVVEFENHVRSSVVPRAHSRLLFRLLL